MNHQEKLTQLEAEYGNAIFARGFLLCSYQPGFVPNSWVTEKVGQLRLYHDPRVPLKRYHDDQKELLLLGDAFDLRYPDWCNDKVAKALFVSLARSEQQLYESCYWIHGRFVVIFRQTDKEPVSVMGDATGMRAIFHTIDGEWIGSHASLVAVNAGKRYRKRPSGRFGYPGRVTAYDDVLVLIPNHKFRSGSDRIERFFPQAPLVELETARVAEEAAYWLQNAVSSIVARHPRPLASLTAGFDSRTTLAISRRFANQIRFFTYYRTDDAGTDQADRMVAQEIAAALDLNHQILFIEEVSSGLPGSFARLCRENSYYRHFPRGAFAYMKIFGESGDVHIRSNLSEIGRAFYLKTKNVRRSLRSGKDMAHAYLTFRAHSVKSSDDQRSIVEDFEHYFEETAFHQVEGLRDTKDMFYWEHRMGAWHGLAVLESDPAFQSFSVFNSRKILDLLMSAPERDRTEGKHLIEIIRRSWPECLELPFNPKKYR